MDALTRYVKWVVEESLAVWSTLGFESAEGRFCERLDMQGMPIDVPRRAMVQARQIYVFADAHRLGWFDDRDAIAERAMASLLRDFCEESGDQARFAFSVSGQGVVTSAVSDAYTHSFILFAVAALYKVNGDRRLLRVAHQTNAFIKARLTDLEHGGLFDEFSTGRRDKRQNPLMHLLEAYLALERSAAGEGFLDDATTLVTLFSDKLLSKGTGVLAEHFSPDWIPVAALNGETTFEPGHHFEWAWLLREYEELAATDVREKRERLFSIAMANGIAPNGLVYDEVGLGQTVIKSSHRVWPHAEAIKAATARHADGDPGALGFAQATAAVVLDTFLDRPFRGAWIDHVDNERRPLVNYVPASSLYHLFFAAAEADKGFGIREPAGQTISQASAGIR